jgi:hypothetical protein
MAWGHHHAAGYGARPAELADLRLAHVDLDLEVLLALGKGPPRTRPAVRS